MTFVDMKNDVAFRKIFGNKKKTKSLISFLNAVLELEGYNRVAKVTFIDPNLLARIKGEKSSVIDVRATDQKGRQFIIEMQVADKTGFGKRVQYYTAKDYSLQILQGEDYPLLNPTYFIGILNFPFGTNSNYHTKHLTIDQESGEHLLSDIQYAFIQLTKFKKKEHELVTLVDKWTYFLKNAKKLKVVPDNTTDEGLKDAYEDAAKYNWTKEELLSYDVASMRVQDARGELEKAMLDGKEEGLREGKEKGLREGKEEGLKEGKEEGLKEGKYEIARTSLSEGLSVLVVSKITSLPIADVQKIADEITSN